jgi:thymidylate synthase (FAD)
MNNSVLIGRNVIKVLDCGYVKFIEHWGSDERIVEAARMSTGKGFQGWGEDRWRCSECGTFWRLNIDNSWSLFDGHQMPKLCCDNSTDFLLKIKKAPGDEKLLKYLWEHKHATPFEMAGLVLEVKAPLFVFREWHRHRTQSYNELSARYAPLPNENYMPMLTRIIEGAMATTNRQAAGTAALADNEQLKVWLTDLQYLYRDAQVLYERGLALGVPKELARLPVPVGRYSLMRASANLRNWLAFLTLRLAPTAQLEIRQYAQAASEIIAPLFPRTHDLFSAERSGEKK